jgi:acetyltransferase (GNAT) family protein
MILSCLYIERPDPRYLQLDPRYEIGFMSASDLAAYASHGEYELTQQYMDRELALGHRCLAITEGDVLASYGWYSTTPTAFSDALWVHFGKPWVYMHKGFTHPAHRGRRLHAIGMTVALSLYRAAGFRGLVSIVDAHNAASLASCARMGYRAFGTIYTMRLGRLLGLRHSTGLLGYPIVVTTPGCRSFGFSLRHAQHATDSVAFPYGTAVTSDAG